MSHYSKYHALADRLRKNRLDRSQGLALQETSPFLARSQRQIHGRQYSFAFAGAERSLDIYHQFDPEEREVEWFFYTETGDFLLQFGFCLKDHRYQVYSVHPGLWMQDDAQWRPYRQALDTSLADHYPPLKLVRTSNGAVEIEAEVI
jgi:hypothetical protein